MIENCIKFDLWTIDWTAIGSIVAVVMIWFTYKSLRQSKKQMNFIEKQYKEANTPKLSCSIVLSGDYLAVKVCNNSSILAPDVSVCISNETKFRNDIFVKYVEEVLQSTIFCFQPYQEIVIPLYITYYAKQKYEGKITLSLKYGDELKNFELYLNSVHFTQRPNSGIVHELKDINSTIKNKQFTFR